MTLFICFDLIFFAFCQVSLSQTGIENIKIKIIETQNVLGLAQRTLARVTTEASASAAVRANAPEASPRRATRLCEEEFGSRLAQKRGRARDRPPPGGGGDDAQRSARRDERHEEAASHASAGPLWPFKHEPLLQRLPQSSGMCRVTVDYQRGPVFNYRGAFIRVHRAVPEEGAAQVTANCHRPSTGVLMSDIRRRFARRVNVQKKCFDGD